MGDKKPDPGRRSFLSIFTDKEQMGEIGRSLGRLVREVREETLPPTQAQLDQVQTEIHANIDDVEAEVQSLSEQVDALQADDATQEELLRDNRDLLVEIMDRISGLEETVAQGQQQAQDEEEKTRWQVVAEKLNKLKSVFVTATAGVLYELLLGDTAWPWLKERWFDLVKPAGVEAQPVSPLPDPEPARIEPPRSSYRSTLKIDWVTIPAGQFWMGSDPRHDSAARKNEQPQHRLYLPTFQIARVPVTNAQYKLFVDATGHGNPYRWRDGQIPSGKQTHPVVGVSWNDAIAFAKWAGVRLPTEAEWEKAARGSDGRIYPWGNRSPTEKHCNFNHNMGDTTAVGSYGAGKSPYGCLDMAGNVWEWCSTIYKDYPYQADDGRENLEKKTGRILRGGSFYGNAKGVRCACRFWFLQGSLYDSVGFRIARGSL